MKRKRSSQNIGKGIGRKLGLDFKGSIDLIFILIVIFFTFIVNDVFAKDQLLINLKSRFDKYKIEDTTEKKQSDRGVIWGPEIIYSFKDYFTNEGTFIRAFYFQGSNNFSNMGKDERKETGVDMGFNYGGSGWGWFYIGGRKIEVNFSNLQIANMSDYKISDIIFGFIFGRITPEIEVNKDYAYLDVWFDSSSLNKERGNKGIAGLKLIFGCRFDPNDPNWIVELGYEIVNFGEIWEHTEKYKEDWEHTSSGFTLKIMYSFSFFKRARD